MFSGYSVTVAIWLANSGHSIVPLEINPYHFLDHQYSSISASFVMKVNLQWVNI